MKKFELMLSKHFLANHPRKGEPTNFVEQFRVSKIHTIRDNYQLWKERFKAIYAGEAVLAVKVWSGEPFKSKKETIAELTKDDGIGIQKMQLYKVGEDYEKRYMMIGDKNVNSSLVALNDGLSQEDWINWFFGKTKYNMSAPFAVIQFTSLRY